MKPDRKTIEIPWSTLLPLLAVFGGIVAQVKLPVSTRPAVPIPAARTLTGMQNMNARLWQDPLSVVQKEWNARKDVDGAGAISPADFDALAKQSQFRTLILGIMVDDGPYAEHGEMRLRTRQAVLAGLSESGFVPADPEHIGFIPVQWPIPPKAPIEKPGTQPAQKDPLLIPIEICRSLDHPSRVNPRGTDHVTILWLSAGSFYPSPLLRFSELIKHLVGTNRARFDVSLLGPATSTGLQHLITEVRAFVSPENSSDAILDNLNIVSHRATASDEALLYEPSPEINLSRSHTVRASDPIQFLQSTIPSLFDSRTTLQRYPSLPLNPDRIIWNDTFAVPPYLGPKPKTAPLFPIPSPIALPSTAPPGTSGLALVPDGNCFEIPRSPTSIADFFNKTLNVARNKHISFQRTIAPDDVTLWTLIEELRKRRVQIFRPRLGTAEGTTGDQMDSSEKRWTPTETDDQIVILTEWDNPHGRHLATTFAALASGQDVRTIVESSGTPHTAWPPWIRQYHYLRGIDGRLPGDKESQGERNIKKDSETPPSLRAVATEGLDQSDFLLRLARQLKEVDEIDQHEADTAGGRRNQERRIRAIGLLGSDVHDKLMLLRALRPAFPDAIIFTNNYDARFENIEDWQDTRNLVIASPFGSRLQEQLQGAILPFRDSYQTATFAGILTATGKIDATIASQLSQAPRVFEVGRRGVYDLTPPESQTSIHPAPTRDSRWLWAWLQSSLPSRHILLSAVALCMMCLWIGLGTVDPTKPGGGRIRDRFRRLCANTAFWLVLTVPTTVLSVGYIYYCMRGAAEEPFAFFSGVSIWPSEMLRILAFTLGLHFLLKAHIQMRDNELDIERRFSLSPSSKTSFFGDILSGLRRWQCQPAGSPNYHFGPQEAWHEYMLRSRFWPRCIRVFILFLVYGVFSYAFFSLFSPPIVPARGDAAYAVDRFVLFASVCVLLVLTFYVVDAIHLNSNLIRIFTSGVNQWDGALLKTSGRTPPLGDKELSRYHDILFVAQRTEVIAPLIWYPLIVLALLFAARSSFFDNWTWPVSLIVIFGLNILWALGSAVYLRRAAESLRKAALDTLQALRAPHYSDKPTQSIFDELITEIQSLERGAFAPLSSQPFIRAILLPSGGLGLLAVAQRWLESSW